MSSCEMPLVVPSTAISASGAGVEGGVFPACSTRRDASSTVSEGAA